jgi:hypothetical protein
MNEYVHEKSGLLLYSILINKPGMKIVLSAALLFSVILYGCKPKENKISLPDLKPNFLQLLNSRDSTLLLDSFYFIRTDTMYEKEALVHQRFPFFRIMNQINDQLKRKPDDIETIEYLNNEKAYVGKEIDSLTRRISGADSVTPIGYRAFYKVTVSKKNQFKVSDTVPYAISLKMKVSDWDRNLEKILDSLVIGRRLHSGGIETDAR